MSIIDQAKNVREGEELPIEALQAYLQEKLSIQGELEIQQFPSGHSNLTYLIALGDKDLVLRRPPFGSKVKSAHDMGREFNILEKLSSVTTKVPRPLLYCEDESIIGAKFYIMERVAGVII